jgi:hypothetical protein
MLIFYPVGVLTDEFAFWHSKSCFQEVTYRKVLQDDGNKQIVEVEQVAGWRFLVFSGSFSSRVIVEQNREQHTVSSHAMNFLHKNPYLVLKFAYTRTFGAKENVL